MNQHEAKFLLRARRPDGRDDRDPIFAEPLSLAANDPRLRAWLEQEQSFDAAFSAKLNAFQPPAGLREAILAGGRASQPRRQWWANPVWLVAAAACVALLIGLKLRTSGPAGMDTRDLATFAMNDLAIDHSQHIGHPGALNEVQAQFASLQLPLTSHLAVDLDDLRAKGCRVVTVGGREVFEICLLRQGKSYHLYVARGDAFSPGSSETKSEMITGQSGSAALYWKDAKYAYSVVAKEGTEALKQLL